MAGNPDNVDSTILNSCSDVDTQTRGCESQAGM